MIRERAITEQGRSALKKEKTTKTTNTGKVKKKKRSENETW